jgi:anti-sigma regulatory factor (Ser/Thr protein kinase)
MHSTGLTPARREDASLMLSELATNALRHGRGAITLRITPSTRRMGAR